MLRKPSSQLHLPLLALLVLALIISIVTLACAASTLRLFESQQGTNPWLLPIWRNHFDLRGLKLVVGTSAAVTLFDLVDVVVLVVLAVQVSLWLFALPFLTLTISLVTAVRNIIQHRTPHISHDKPALSLSRPPSCYSPSRSQCSCTREGHAAELDLWLGFTGTEHPRRNAGRFRQSVWRERKSCRFLLLSSFRGCQLVDGDLVVIKDSLDHNPRSVETESATQSTSAAHQADSKPEPQLIRPSSQRFATYAPLATLFLHLALLALSLAALQKAKNNTSTRAATPNSEDGEKMELEEYRNFPKDNKA